MAARWSLSVVLLCVQYRFSHVDWSTWSRCGYFYHTWDLECRPTMDRSCCFMLSSSIVGFHVNSIKHSYSLGIKRLFRHRIRSLLRRANARGSAEIIHRIGCISLVCRSGIVIVYFKLLTRLVYHFIFR